MCNSIPNTNADETIQRFLPNTTSKETIAGVSFFVIMAEWRGGRVVYRTALEMRRVETHREFESPPLRSCKKPPARAFFVERRGAGMLCLRVRFENLLQIFWSFANKKSERCTGRVATVYLTPSATGPSEGGRLRRRNSLMSPHDQKVSGGKESHPKNIG